MMLLPLLFIAATLETNELQADVHLSKTAELFHIVDQLSNWSPHCHQQYRRYFKPTAEDEAVLQTHAKLRKTLGGYGVLDHAFYSDGTVEQALAELPAEARETEAKVLAYFEPKVGPFLRENAGLVDKAKARLAGEGRVRIETFTREASRFFLGAKANVPVYLIPSFVGQNGGGYNGDRLTVEVSPTKDGVVDADALIDVFYHETWHAFAKAERARMDRAVATFRGLDGETLSEGFAHAVAPGIYGSPPEEQLFDRLAQDPKKPFNHLAIALLPSLQDALRTDATIVTYLPTAVAIYRGVALLIPAATEAKPRFFVFGQGARDHGKAIFDQGYDIWIRDLSKRSLDELQPKMLPSDVVVIAVVKDEAIPAEYQALFLDKWPDVVKSMQAHPEGIWSGTWNDRKVAALWAKDAPGLAPLIAKVPSNYRRKVARAK
jgi:hypothetical protein